MKRILFFLLLLGVPGILRVSAQPNPPGDTLLYTLPGSIVVEALRMPSSYADAPAPVSVIDAAAIRCAPSRSVSDLLRSVPGVNIRAYGGGGSIDIASLRGLDAEYTLVLLNGVRINNAQINTVDLDKISLQGIDQIEVVRGGYSSLYGSDALGGVISIRSSGTTQRSFAGAGMGSFGWRQFEAGTGASIGATSVSLSGFYEESENDYPFTLPKSEIGSGNRLRSNFVQRGISLRSATQFARSSLAVSTALGSTDAGAPGAIMSIYQGFARQQDQSANVSANYQHQILSGLMLQCVPSFVYSIQKYYDFSYLIDSKPLDATYVNTQYGLTLTADHRISRSFIMAYGSDIQYSILRSGETTGTPMRLSIGAFATADWAVDGESRRMRIIPSLRADMHRDMGQTLNEERLSPSLAAVYSFLPDWLALRARVGLGYRAPTFNQLYWAQGGNPNVQVESSVATDAGIRITSPYIEGASMELGYFHHSIADKIIWRPGKGIFWTPVNIRDVASNGIEAQCAYASLNKVIAVNLNGQWISSRQMNEEFPGDEKRGKQLIYVPEFSGALSMQAAPFASTTVSIVGVFTGKRYYSATNDKYLEPYTTWDISIAQSVELTGVQVILKGEAVNVFDESYQITAFYPMPGRSFRLSLTTQLQ